jgi:hypothetical protein
MYVLLKDFSLASTWMQNQIQLKYYNINEIMPLTDHNIQKTAYKFFWNKNTVSTQQTENFSTLLAHVTCVWNVHSINTFSPASI